MLLLLTVPASTATQDGAPGTPGAPAPRPQSPGRPTPGAPPRIDPLTGARDRAAEKSEGTAQIRGRVIGGEAGQPLRRAIVWIHGEALEEGRLTTTDEHGRYEFKDLPAGRAFLTADKAGYVRLSYGQRRTGEGGRPLEIAAGQRLDNIDFSLPRGGVITGRVADEFGEAVAGLPVRVLQYRYADGRRQLAPSGMMSETDDLGRFRVYGLPAGDYYVMASGEGDMVMGGRSDARSGFSPTYFPGTPSVSEAQRVRVSTGTETGSINFSLLPARTAQVSGVVLDSRGQAVSRGFIGVLEGSKGRSGFSMFGGGMIRTDGHFTISSLTPGDYILHVNLEMRSQDGESAAVPITVASEDIDGLTIVTSPGALVMGQALFEAAPPDRLKPPDFGFYVTAIDPVSPMRGRFVTLKDDWTFETRMHEGPALIRGMKLPEGWVLKSVMQGGVDVTDTGIEFRHDERIEGVQLVLSNRISALTGIVTDSQGRPARDYAVVVFPEDAGRWAQRSRYLFAARPAQEGRYEVTKLPAGQYMAVAVEYLEDGQHTDPEYLGQIRGYATPFQLADGERRVLNLKLATAP